MPIDQTMNVLNKQFDSRWNMPFSGLVQTISLINADFLFKHFSFPYFPCAKRRLIFGTNKNEFSMFTCSFSATRGTEEDRVENKMTEGK